MSQDQHGLICPFWIDTEAYSDRDRRLFVCGYEFCQILSHLRHNPGALKKTIHRENESRVRMACGRFGRTCKIEVCEAKYDPEETWSYLEVSPRREAAK